MTNRQYYEKALKYLALAPFVPIESIGLVAVLFEVPARTVAQDIGKARKEEYHYAQD